MRQGLLPSAQLLLQVLDLRLQAVDGSGDLAAEGIELSSACALRGAWTVVLLAFENHDVLLQAIDGSVRIALFLPVSYTHLTLPTTPYV